METDKIICIEYNGAFRPFSVFTSDLRTYDIDYHNGGLTYHYSGFGSRPYVSPFADPKKKRWLWFAEEFRPRSASLPEKVLNNHELEAYGFQVIQSPQKLEDLESAIERY